jgi:DNA-binding MarR family transcriptional regulator
MTETTREDLLARCACFDLRKATRAVSRLYDDCLRPLDLNITQYSLLRVIEGTPQISVSTLGRYMVMDRTSITRALAPLERDGLIRSRAGSDKRTRIISLTKRGTKLIANAKPHWDEAQKTFLELIGNKRWTVMRGLLWDTTHAVRCRSEARELTRRSAKTRTKNPHRASRRGQSTDPPALGST